MVLSASFLLPSKVAVKEQKIVIYDRNPRISLYVPADPIMRTSRVDFVGFSKLMELSVPSASSKQEVIRETERAP